MHRSGVRPSGPSADSFRLGSSRNRTHQAEAVRRLSKAGKVSPSNGGVSKQMRTAGGEVLKETIRRSVPIVVVLVALGAVALNVIRLYQGPKYEASAKVLFSSIDLGAALVGTESFEDPERAEDTELEVAGSAELYERTARSTGGNYGDSEALQEAMLVDVESDVLTFTGSSDDRARASQIANAVAREYIDWREELSGETIRDAIAQVRREIATEGEKPLLRQQLNRLQLMEALNSGNAVVMQRADAAVKTSPRPVRDSILGGALGFLIGLLIVGVREVLNTRVRSEGDVEDILGVPVLATVRTFPRRARLVMLGRHEAEFGDTYAVLAANLMQLAPDGESTVVAVTSAIAGEGKTSTAANVAVALARRGKSVILADFDVRKPSVAEVFRIPKDAAGLVQAVRNGDELTDLLWSVGVNGVTPRWEPVPPLTNGKWRTRNGDGGGSLLVLPAGGSLPAGSGTKVSEIGRLLAGLRTEADIVVLDTPPALLTAEMTELSRNVDIVVAVVRQGRSTRRSLHSLARRAQNWSSQFVGAVLTDVPGDEHRAYYGRSYYGR
jgi:succinoglycan biosynthesis transport protein ExoP